jgi:hypothetical protein
MNATTDRRSMLLGALTAGAAATVAIVPAIAAFAPDPIFSRIEALKTAEGHVSMRSAI